MNGAESLVRSLVAAGVDHVFTNPGSTEKGEKYNLPLAYDAAADKDSWDALMRFIKEK